MAMAMALHSAATKVAGFVPALDDLTFLFGLSVTCNRRSRGSRTLCPGEATRMSPGRSLRSLTVPQVSAPSSQGEAPHGPSRFGARGAATANKRRAGARDRLLCPWAEVRRAVEEYPFRYVGEALAEQRHPPPHPCSVWYP